MRPDGSRSRPIPRQSGSQDQDQIQGYGSALELYLSAGWPSVLPLPRGKKEPPPGGCTGRGTPMPTVERMRAWAEQHPDGNVALRLPEGILAVDVDAYGGKPGA